jgi:chaperonin GroES
MIEVRNDWLLIRIDPESKMSVSGLIHKPDGAHEHIFATAEVLKVGPGKWVEEQNKRMPMDVQPGDGVVYMKFVATHTKTAEAIRYALPEDQAMIRINDVLLVYDRKDPPVISQ